MVVSKILEENGTNYFEAARKELVDKSILISDTWPFPTIMACYLIFIFFGNRVMEKRNPMNLKLLMIAYNTFQVIYNSYMFCLCMKPEALRYYVTHVCQPMDPSKNVLFFDAFRAAHLFVVSRLIDLIDTVFFVLRKKVDHISFLHLYHHISMATISWALLKYYPTNAEQVYPILLANSLIHVIMYTYFLLSLLGPSIRKYLWWKKYVTQLQLMQFIIYIGFGLVLTASECPLPKDVSMMIFAQGTVFFVLFAKFYSGRYNRQTSPAVETTAISENKNKKL